MDILAIKISLEILFQWVLFVKKVMSALTGMSLFTGIKKPFVSSQKHHV